MSSLTPRRDTAHRQVQRRYLASARLYYAVRFAHRLRVTDTTRGRDRVAWLLLARADTLRRTGAPRRQKDHAAGKHDRLPGMTDSNSTRGWRRAAAYTLSWWIVLFGLWFLLVDSLAHPEVAAGPFAALLAAGVALGVWRAGDEHHRFRWRWLREMRRVPGGVLRDTAVVMTVLWRRVATGERPRSAFRIVPFPGGMGDDAESESWRAFCTFATSLTPNTFVVGIDRDRKQILVHQLAPEPAIRLRRSVAGAATDGNSPGEGT